MSTDQPNGFAFRIGSLERRVDKLEDLKPEVLASEVKNLHDDVNALKRAFYTFAISAVGAAIIFAFSVFALLGQN